MEQNLDTPLSLEELARRCRVSLRQLQRLFEQELSTSPRAWYLRLRLERARHLLKETDLDILSVGLSSGFTSSSSFSRATATTSGIPRARRAEAWLVAIGVMTLTLIVMQ